VGAVTDATGKEQVTDGGAGKFITQGAGDIVQSALFKAGASVVNRRDPRIIENEAKWGLIDVKKQAATTFFITGSINSLDFLPGSGV
jgi:curli biogenesis system outer membrane secretion channel CsgG